LGKFSVAAAFLAGTLWIFGWIQLFFFSTLVAAMLFEHGVLRFYSKISSIDRIFRTCAPSVRLDIICFLLRESAAANLLLKLSYPGLVYLALTYWKLPSVGLFASLGLVPQNQVALFAIYLLLHDFGRYIAHVAMHKVPALWELHKFHHAATEYNMLVNHRFSWGESAINLLIDFVVITFVCGVPNPEFILAAMLSYRFIEVFQHTDIPWNYGKIGYLVASPRFHRMHHSSDPRDYNSNYADTFSFWDVIFRTANKRYLAAPWSADTVRVGLGKGEDHKINRRWLTGPFTNGTLVPTIWSSFRRTYRSAVRSIGSGARARKKSNVP
jgi:sterol desaturase/sphingolipid hydroxylase (fatty acid hydroxylase superfamily)